MKALVTGANAFLGRHVVDALLARGIEVRAMVLTRYHELPKQYFWHHQKLLREHGQGTTGSQAAALASWRTA